MKKQTRKSTGIPVIDIEKLYAPETLQALDMACRDWGFFQVVNHGMDNVLCEALLQQARAFFAEPLEQKRQIRRTADNPWGFFDEELTKNTRDWKEVFDYGPAGENGERPQWPQRPVGLRTAVVAYYEACETLAFRLLGAVSLNLGVPADFLNHAFLPRHSSFVRINYYPRCPKPERPQGLTQPASGHLGVNQHTDAGALTILLQDDEPGLEVFRNGTWNLVPAVEDALVINIGDIVQVWSNDRYRAALHRVRANAQAQRFSVPFFFNPRYDVEYAPLSTTILDGPLYRPINWGEFRRLRAAGDYQDLGREVQIDQFRI
ncbi:MAG: 2OG-Fe(II) oxygenase family protein [Pseudomonadales bacterium]